MSDELLSVVFFIEKYQILRLFLFQFFDFSFQKGKE
jgi:hypothetical protein